MKFLTDRETGHTVHGDFISERSRTLWRMADNTSFPFPWTVADIQEFYELTLLDESKSVQQKTAETIRIADKWEASDGPITPTFAQNDVSTVIKYTPRPY
ncbi:Disks large 1 tumor suppressor protein [Camponotus floridanus]|uniref:Disks large 1 tumor suppressor protein n=1 Tax=Camponotus floridanus TaxID=104421 RepID=E1ZYM4_CAMFO|nr:Disks large 1 tumor suppressor protein [Camponotus floridanus]